MTVGVSVKTVEPTPTAVVAAAVTWAEFPALWKPMLDEVWSFLRAAPRTGFTGTDTTSCSTRMMFPTSRSAFRSPAHLIPSVGLPPRRFRAAWLPTATHIGPVSALGYTYQAIGVWSEANGYRRRAALEIYGDPDLSTGDFPIDVFWSLAAP